MKHLKNILAMLSTAIIFSIFATIMLNMELSQHGMQTDMVNSIFFFSIMFIWLLIIFYAASLFKANQYLALGIAGFLTPIAMILTSAVMYWFNLSFVLTLPSFSISFSMSSPDFSKFYQIIVAGIVIAGANLLTRYAFTKIGDED